MSLITFLFQSYYSLIFNSVQDNQTRPHLHFNPIIVLFLTKKFQEVDGKNNNFNPIIVLFLTKVNDLQ